MSRVTSAGRVSSSWSALWTRRAWLSRQTAGLAAVAATVRHPRPWGRVARLAAGISCQLPDAAQFAATATPLDLEPWEALAQRAVEVAQAAGARYAEARLTRIVIHEMGKSGMYCDSETIGVGVRAVVGNAWGFSASAIVTPEEIVRLAQDAVGQATANAKQTTGTIELGHVPVVRGRWSTPVQIDPFTISLEEKHDYLNEWYAATGEVGLGWANLGDDLNNWLTFSRQERVVATSEGSVVTQTLLESGGTIQAVKGVSPFGGGGSTFVKGIDTQGAGWELMLEAKIREQFLSGQIAQDIETRYAIPQRPFTVGKYLLVCDGATMAALVEATIGAATQLDRAFGYEANAGGTSWIDDPLRMVGTATVTAPPVTLTANRSASRHLATVGWDEEGVVPEPFTLIKDGVLVDFQTTREQAAWLAPYYQLHGQAVRSHGCAAAESAHMIPLQHMPNLQLAPSPTDVSVADLIAMVPNGIWVEGGRVAEIDFQGRTGLLTGYMREITNGRLGHLVSGGGVLFNSAQLWKNVRAIGGAATQGEVSYTPYTFDLRQIVPWYTMFNKGQPSQRVSHTVRAVAALIGDQPLVDPTRKP